MRTKPEEDIPVPLDGNAVAGLLRDVFELEITTA